MWKLYFNLTLADVQTLTYLHDNLYSPAVTVEVIFKVYFTTLVHDWWFWTLTPYFNKFPVVLQDKNSIF